MEHAAMMKIVYLLSIRDWGWLALLMAVCLPGSVAAQYTENAALNAAGGGTASESPYSFTDTVGQPTIGTGSGGVYALSEGFWHNLNVLPLVPERVSSAYPGQTVLISAAKLLAQASDEDGDTLQVSEVSASSVQGGVLTLQSGVISYTAPNSLAGPDTFTYAVLDSGGDLAVATVTINALSSQTANIISAVHAAHPLPTFTVKFAGLPGATYQLQASPDLIVWTDLPGGFVTVPASGAAAGLGVFVENDPPGLVRYYRTIYVSGP